ncbi:MAG: MoxR family ATPase [Lewinellaceae bacterium]|nr:MoxR family ATPase [Lewinellaceae bacterium]
MNYYAEHQGKGIPDFDDSLLQRLTAREDYIVSPALQRAVNLAIFLGQPLLLTGEPGTGKTELARHLAQHFSKEEKEEHFFFFNTKTTSSAQDLFYRYDSLKHFQYVQNHKEELGAEEVEKRFIQYQALGAAIRSDQRCVVLIDEVDKAPRDFPNDILDVMEKLSFEVPELGLVGERAIRTTPEKRPIVVLTSNSEKNLPDAFLRRCVFFNIDFPDDDMLADILERKTSRLDKEQLKRVVEFFHSVRGLCKRKKPSTAELLQWATVLEKLDASGQLKVDQLANLSEAERIELHGTLGLLVKDKEDLKTVLEQL